MTSAPRERFRLLVDQGPVLCGIPFVDDGTSWQQARELATAAASNGCGVIQLRWKKPSSSAELFDAALSWREALAEGTLLIVNDRADIAALSGAHGVHVGQDDLPAARLRERFHELVIGLSTHNEDQVRQANDLDLDYIGVGPVYGTSSKDNPDPVVGLEILAKICTLSKHPVIAIGGISRERYPDVISAGTAGAAIMGDLFGNAPTPATVSARATAFKAV